MRKTSLTNRVSNYLLFYGRPSDNLVPMHPDEFYEDKSWPQIRKAQDAHNVRMFPLGQREIYAKAN